jgi:hypothetical protein
MRRKQIISPEKPVENRVEYRFKLLFLPFLSCCLAIAILYSFVSSIVILMFVSPILLSVISSISVCLVVIIIETLLPIYLIRISDQIITPTGISGLDFWQHRIELNWQEIASIKPYQVLGMRHLSIKTTSGKNIQLAIRFYDTVRLLDRVRELAGSEHILVRALEKELSRPRHELKKLWGGIIGSIALTICIYLIGGNMYAAEQEKPLEQEIATYVRQHPKTAPNQSAIELQSLMTKLGLSVEVFGDGSEVKVKPEKSAIAEWKEIEPTFRQYLDKQQQTQASIEPIPAKLATYLKTHQADLEAIETHLIGNSIPEWGSDLGWIQQVDWKAANYSSKWMNSLQLLNVENLIIINIFDKQQLANVEISRDLAAIEKIQQSFQQQPSLIEQLFARIEERRIAKLVRQVERIPSEWGDNLFSSDRHQQMRNAVVKQSLTNVRGFQSADIFDRLSIDTQSPLRFIPGYYALARPQIRLATIDWYNSVQQDLAYWERQNICLTTGNSGVKSISIPGIDLFLNSSHLSSQYLKVLKPEVFWELTTSVRKVKAKLAAGQKIDLVASEFNLPSQVCPGEKWTAKVAGGSVQIEFSHPPDWNALGVHPTDIDPLAYTIKPIDLIQKSPKQAV